MTTFESNKAILRHILDVAKPGLMLKKVIQAKSRSKKILAQKRGAIFIFYQVLLVKGSLFSIHKIIFIIPYI